MKAVILCDGQIPPSGLIEPAVQEADLFIAADGGANTARDLGLEPDLITGDLDSYVYHPEESNKIIRDSDQETNDLEKALSLAEQRGARRVVVYGATGKRLDHTLKNLSVLKKYLPRFDDLRYMDQYGEILLLPKTFRRRVPPGTVLSLFPLSGAVSGITTRGLRYPLHGETLENGVRDGSSNEAVSEQIEITHEKGDLLLFIVTHPDNH